MKHIFKTLPLAFFIGCSSSTPLVTPSENASLNTLSPSNAKKRSGFMQKSLDNFVKNDWTPTLSKDESIQKKYMKVEDGERSFTLQEYTDKISAYMKAKPSTTKDSHIDKLNSLPVIGK